MTVRSRRKAPRLEPVLRSLYGALNEDVSFSHSLETVADVLRSHVSGIHYEDGRAGHSSLTLVGVVGTDELTALARDYDKLWKGENLWWKRGLEQLFRQGYNDGDDVVSEAELFASPYYQRYLRRIDIRHGLGICLWHGGPGQLAVATFNRSAVEGAYSIETMRFVAALHPHLVNAFAIHRHACHLKAENQSLRDALDRSPVGAMTLGADGRVVFSNAEADRLLNLSQGIVRGRNQALSFECAIDAQAVHASLLKLTSGQCATQTTSHPVQRRSPGMAPTLILHLCALPERVHGLSEARCIAFLCPLERGAMGVVDGVIIQIALGLTPAEARVVMTLREKHDLDAVAASLHVSLSTVKSHLKHAFAKSGARKQSDLLSMVERLVAQAPRLADTVAGMSNREVNG